LNQPLDCDFDLCETHVVAGLRRGDKAVGASQITTIGDFQERFAPARLRARSKETGVGLALESDSARGRFGVRGHSNWSTWFAIHDTGSSFHVTLPPYT
jgi:hypothetical protein